MSTRTTATQRIAALETQIAALLAAQVAQAPAPTFTKRDVVAQQAAEYYGLQVSLQFVREDRSAMPQSHRLGSKTFSRPIRGLFNCGRTAAQMAAARYAAIDYCNELRTQFPGIKVTNAQPEYLSRTGAWPSIEFDRVDGETYIAVY